MNFAAYIFVVCSPLLSAPSVMHIFINPAFVSMLAACFLSFISIIRTMRVYGLILRLLIVSLAFVSFSLLTSLANGLHDKFFEYLAFYILFLAAVLLISNISFQSCIKINILNKIFFCAMLGMAFFSVVEYYYIYTNMGEVPFIPRVARDSYLSSSFSDFYRLRLLTYESSAAGLVVNVFYLSYFITGKHRSNYSHCAVIIIALYLQIAIFSTAQFCFFVAIVVIQIARGKNIGYIASLITVVLIIVSSFFIYKDLLDIYYYIIGKLLSFLGEEKGYASGSERLELLEIGWYAFLNSPLVGGGLGSFYNYVETGLVNFHLQTLQQVGLLGYLLFSCVLFYPLVFFKKYDLETKILFMVVWATFFVSGGVWDSIFYVPYLFSNWRQFSSE